MICLTLPPSLDKINFDYQSERTNVFSMKLCFHTRVENSLDGLFIIHLKGTLSAETHAQ